jgi:spore germination cell wall hydrolase CwlJ-like protein
MKLAAGAGIAIVIFAIAAARAQGGGADSRPAPMKPPADWGEWTRPLQPHRVRAETPAPVRQALVADDEIDVVDAHWMALTMWGEARSGGEEAMRAVGHVIDNRRRSGAHGAYATETVSEAWQFSCWNKGDPNYSAMLNVDSLRPGSEDQRMWVAAKRVAEEILSGQSVDPTGGALFYHTAAVSPHWSDGLAPVSVIGGHLFFRTAR